MQRGILFLFLTAPVPFAVGCSYFDSILTTLGFSSSPIAFTITMNGDSEVPPVQTNASATVRLILDTDAKELRYELEASGFTSDFTVAQIHNAPAGKNGPVVYAIADSLTQNGDTIAGTGTWPLRDQDLSELLAGNIYLSIHSQSHATSEIRGQIIVPTENAQFETEEMKPHPKRDL